MLRFVCRPGLSIGHISREVRHRKHWMLASFCTYWALSILSFQQVLFYAIWFLVRALQLRAAQACNIQCICCWLWTTVARCSRWNFWLHHRWQVDACLQLLLKGRCTHPVRKDTCTYHMSNIGHPTSLKIFSIILCFRLPQHINVISFPINLFSFLILSEIRMCLQLSLHTSLLFFIGIVDDWQLPLLGWRLVLQHHVDVFGDGVICLGSFTFFLFCA